MAMQELINWPEEIKKIQYLAEGHNWVKSEEQSGTYWQQCTRCKACHRTPKPGYEDRYPENYWVYQSGGNYAAQDEVPPCVPN